MDEPNYLNPDLAGKFAIRNTHCPIVLNSPVGDIDFRTLSQDQAEKLIEADFYYLERVATKQLPPPVEVKPAIVDDAKK